MLLTDLSACPSRIFSALNLLAQDRGETGNVLKIRVPATSSPYLAGLPAGTYTTSGDRAPQQSPVLVELPIGNAAYVSFSASGNVQHHPFRPPRYDSPIGSLLVSHVAEHGISQIGAPIDSLIGVFLDDNRPDQSPAPPPINFGAAGWNFVLLEPQLKQVFLIGTGHVKVRVDGSSKKSDVSRRFRVPRGATRLFLAVMDAYEWNNNEGYFDVTVTTARTDTSSSAYNVDSSAYSVDSNATFAKWSCLPDRRQCTPDRAVVEGKGTRQYHVILPAQLEWGVSISTPASATAGRRASLGNGMSGLSIAGHESLQRS